MLLTAFPDSSRLIGHNYIIKLLYTQEQEQYDETSDYANKELDHVTCHYDYMMRLSQPDVPCPDPATIQSMLQYHYHLMSVSSQNGGMCSGMTYPSSTMVRSHS